MPLTDHIVWKTPSSASSSSSNLSGSSGFSSTSSSETENVYQNLKKNKCYRFFPVFPSVWAPLEKPLERVCVSYTRFVVRHTSWFMLAPILSTFLLSTGVFFRFKVARGVDHLYSALDAPWRAEREVFERHWTAHKTQMAHQKYADGNFFERREEAQALLQLIQRIEGVSLRTPNGSDVYGYRDICLKVAPDKCFGNKKAKSFVRGLLLAQSEASEMTRANQLLKQEKNLNSELQEQIEAQRKLLLQKHQIYSTEELKHQILPFQLSKSIESGEKQANLVNYPKVKAIPLIFPLVSDNSEEIRQLIRHFELEVGKLLSNPNNGFFGGKSLELSLFHSGTLDVELAQSTIEIAPRFALTFAILTVFAVACSFRGVWTHFPSSLGKQWKLFVPDWTRSKPLLGLVGVLATLTAIASATGLLLWLEITFVDMCSVMPFLALTIGIDDTFLILEAWESTDRNLRAEERVVECMRHTAVSITITSATDALAFLIGSIAPMPAVTHFCQYSAAAICFIYLHFMTMFIAFLAIQGRMERQGRNSVFNWKVDDADSLLVRKQRMELLVAYKKPSKFAKFCSNLVVLIRLFLNYGTTVKKPRKTRIPLNKSQISPPKTIAVVFPPPYQSQNRYKSGCKNCLFNVNGKGMKKAFTDSRGNQNFFTKIWVPVLTNRWTQFLIFALMFAYGFATYEGIQKLRIGFSLKEFLSKDVLAHRFLELRDEFFPTEAQRLDIAVLHPPYPLNNGTQWDALLEAIGEMERIEGCFRGEPKTDFWFFQWADWTMEKFRISKDALKSQGSLEATWNLLQSFIQTRPKYAYDIRFSQLDPNRIEAFRLSMQLTVFENDDQLMGCARRLRSICKEHHDFEIYTYSPLNWKLVDQFEVVWPQTLQDLWISVVVMVLIAALAIPHPYCAAAIAASILSVGFGVLGLMGWTGINLDATSMISIAMSVGFSVDFAAHVTFAYGSSRPEQRDEPRERLKSALGVVGWPICQASASMLIGISTLATVDTYIIRTCFKTIAFVICIGLVHALVFLPLALLSLHSLINNLLLWIAGNRHRSNN